MEITKIKALWPENKNFALERQDTGEEYIFIHLLTPAYMVDKNGVFLQPAGSCILYDKHIYQYLAATGDGLLHNWAHIKGDVGETAARYGIKLNTVYHVDNDRFVTELMQSAELELLHGKPFHEEICHMYISELFIRLSRLEEDAENVKISEETHEAFVRLRTQVHMRYAENWDVDSMAKNLNLSVSRFYVLYKAIFGVSPKQDLRNIRIEHAKDMLLYRKCSVKEVAEAVGYRNEYYFIRHFKDLTGKTPGKYR